MSYTPPPEVYVTPWSSDPSVFRRHQSMFHIDSTPKIPSCQKASAHGRDPLSGSSWRRNANPTWSALDCRYRFRTSARISPFLHFDPVIGNRTRVFPPATPERFSMRSFGVYVAAEPPTFGCSTIEGVKGTAVGDPPVSYEMLTCVSIFARSPARQSITFQSS